MTAILKYIRRDRLKRGRSRWKPGHKHKPNGSSGLGKPATLKHYRRVTR